MARIAAVLVVVLLTAGCLAQPAPRWDGEPWTNTHDEPCRNYAPITWEWVARHPGHPCAQPPAVPSETGAPDDVELGPACSQTSGGPLVCTQPR
jgi:hypothetical protein